MHDSGACLKLCGPANQKGADKVPVPCEGVDPFFFFDKLVICTKFIKNHSSARKEPDLR